jgi:predicted enzyme involved in methoxymalonyl-ACP biosynthesis
LLGTYLPTEKNKLVENHYEKLGFALVERQSDGSSRWQLTLDRLLLPPAVPMHIERIGFAAAVAA